MTKFKKKPIEIEAEQWFPDKPIDGVEFPVLNAGGYQAPDYIGQGRIETLKGLHHVSPGDWVIIGIKGEKYSCKPDIFDKTYELVEKTKLNPQAALRYTE